MEDLDLGLTPEERARKKALMAAVLAAAPKPQQPKKMVASTSGTTAAPEAPFTNADKKAPEIPDNEALWKQRRDALDAQAAEIARQANAPIDGSGYERTAKQRGDLAGNNAMLALLAQQTTGFEGFGKQLMANALATQGAQEFDGGLVDPSGKFVENVKDARRRQLQSSEFLLGQGDRRLTADMAAADRAEGRQIQREDRASAAEFRKLQAAHLRAQTAALGQKPDPVSVVPEGSALFNRATGQWMTAPGGAPRGGLPKSATTADKNTFSESSDALTLGAGLSRRLGEMTADEKDAMGGIRPALNAGMRNMTQGSLGVPNWAMPGNEKTRSVGVEVARQGAEIAHKLYGASVTGREGFRADLFIPQVGDDFATVKRKVDAAMAHAAQQKQAVADRYGVQPSPFAPTQQSTGAPALPAGFKLVD